ncbi:hypothetical protein M6D93_17255 [Jatrophihabitans telluris]|uniref:Uncharacterized protein n=1 Tax=Jatrophihabitans telluris TaxID=2038343 RepID=A0ABY4QYF7_9ACTN|nr:hypothetical protein [Jatrophihabitans telluris]UQX88026.1 hypothetical protein M6D93_17255 [Jatrophihabitans telluris]
MFVVVITVPDQPMINPRVIGPFDSWDLAQAFSQTLIAKWDATSGENATVTVTRMEDALPGVVVGELAAE